jgi:4-amino-4-deoxy-L-arabinose transferase-like glycosyltransferase
MLLLVAQVAILAFTAFRWMPAEDEPGHFMAGVSHWQTQNLSWYRVNPPIPRMLATFIPYLMGARIDVPILPDAIEARPEFFYGFSYFRSDPQRALLQLGVARLVAMIWALIGSVVIFLWGRSLWGDHSGLFSVALWVFSPLVIANSQLITPDVASATMGLLAGYTFSNWLNKPIGENWMFSGLALGVAQLTKFTLIVLVPLWLLVWCAVGMLQSRSRADWFKQSRQMLYLMLVALLVINVVYGFTGTGTKLKDYQFLSQLFAGKTVPLGGDSNRFRDTWLGEIPVPLPTEVLLGIDLQQRDFEGVYTSFLRGQERRVGWLHYYIYAYVIKEPIGFLLLLPLAIGMAFRTFCMRSELLLVLVPVTVFSFVSLKTGFNHHLRYILPAVPYLFVWCGRLMANGSGGRYWLRWTAVGMLVYGIAESLSVFPYSYAHFNLLVAGSANGYKHLDNSNLGWGQESHLIPRLRAKYPGIIIAKHLLPVFERHKTDNDVASEIISRGLNPDQLRQRIKPGIYAIHAYKVGIPSSPYYGFRNLDPIEVLGYTVRVYEIGPTEIDLIVSELVADEFNN